MDVRVTIVVDEKVDLAKVAEACRAVGLRGLLPLATSHLITGSIEEQFLPNLASVAGVETIERQRTNEAL